MKTDVGIQFLVPITAHLRAGVTSPSFYWKQFTYVYPICKHTVAAISNAFTSHTESYGSYLCLGKLEFLSVTNQVQLILFSSYDCK